MNQQENLNQLCCPDELEEFFCLALDLLCIADIEGNLIRVSQSWESVLGYSTQELEQGNVMDYIHPDDLKITFEELAKLKRKETISTCVNRYRHQDGSYRTIEWRSQIFDNLIYATGRDITERRQFEIQFKKNQELLTQTSELARVGGWEVDLITNELIWTDMTKIIHDLPLNYQPTLEEAINFYKDEETREIVKKAINNGINCGQSWYFELQIITARRREIWVRAIGKAEFKEGKCIRIYGIIQDIDSRRKSDLALRDSEEFLKQIFENLPLMVFVKDAENLNFLKINQAAETIIGLKKEDLLGHNDYDFFGQEEADFYRDIDQKVLEKKELIKIEEKINSLTLGERILHTRKIPILDYSGQPKYLLGISEDITEQKKVEIELKKTRELLAQTNTVAKVGGWEFNLTTQEIYWTDITYQIHEYPRDFQPTLENVIASYKEGENRHKMSMAIQNAITEGIPFELELQLISGMGRELWIKIICQTVIKEGKCIRIYGTCQDIDQQKKQEIALAEKSQEYNKLVSTIPIGIYKLNKNKTFAYVSSVFCEMLNQTEENILNNPYSVINLIHPEDIDNFMIENDKALDQHLPFNQEARFIINGETRWLQMRSTPQEDKDGNWYWFGTQIDITKEKIAELELIETKTKLESILNYLEDCIWSVSMPDQKTLFVSPGVEQIYEVPIATWIEDSSLWHELIHPEDKGIIDIIWHNLNTKGYSESEYRIISGGNNVKWISNKSRLIKNNFGEIIRADGIIRDITAQQEAKIALIESERKLKNLITNMPGVAYQCANDRFYTINFISDEIERLTRYKAEDFINQKINFANIIHPDDLRKVNDNVEASLINHIPYEMEYRLLCQKGHIIWVYERGKGVFDDDNNLLYLEGVIFDITQQKNVEEELLTREKMLSAISQATKELLTNKNVDQAIANGLSILGKGIKADQSYYFSIEEEDNNYYCYHQYECFIDDRQPIKKHPQLQKFDLNVFPEAGKSMIKGETFQIFLKDIAEDVPLKSMFIEQKIKSFILIPFLVDNKPQGFIGFDDCQKERIWSTAEISLLSSFADSIASAIARKALEENLLQAKENAEKANQTKTDFIAAMSHEIRTPLTSVIGYTDLLLTSHLDSTNYEYLESVNNSAKLLKALVNDVLDIAQIEAEKLELVIGIHDIWDLSNQVIKMFRPQVNQKIELVLNYEQNVPRFAFVDKMRLTQILINLVGNASKFTEKGKIELKVNLIEKDLENNKSQIEFSVIDTGIGIAEEKQQQIFEAFTQENNSIARNYGGNGLGLTISTKLLALMNSHLDLESKQGIGSRFFFTLWIETLDTHINLSSPTETNINNQVEINWHQLPVTILIAEDNKVNLKLIKLTLKKILPNVQVIEAENGQEAIELFLQNSPDLILMDINMPIMNGDQATKRIRNQEKENHHIPIIALTANLSKEKYRYLEAGMNDYLSKPIVLDELTELLKYYLQKKVIGNRE